MKGAYAHMPGERRERYRLVSVLFEVLRRARHGLVDRARFGARGTASLARTVSRALGVGGGLEELHARPCRTARRAGGPAENPRRAHRVHEASVEPPVALLYRAPGGGPVGKRCAHDLKIRKKSIAAIRMLRSNVLHFPDEL